ncbi:LAMI_0C00694g1_1 [Lachancea mirantina]|uniref:LAMI_0C00694g1_1 n=1 Tax=Lachancea mirantina TaxID=1230905 RepID=A0A1G4IZM6_9SACH|nr:LAMI_0C00694g1_1 [Lachancea mirantina]
MSQDTRETTQAVESPVKASTEPPLPRPEDTAKTESPPVIPWERTEHGVHMKTFTGYPISFDGWVRSDQRRVEESPAEIHAETHRETHPETHPETHSEAHPGEPEEHANGDDADKDLRDTATSEPPSEV